MRILQILLAVTVFGAALQAQTVLHGQVTDQYGNPISNAFVEATGGMCNAPYPCQPPNNTSHYDWTSSFGFYQMPNPIWADTWLITAHHPRYVTQAIVCTTACLSGNAEINFVLEEK